MACGKAHQAIVAVALPESGIYIIAFALPYTCLASPIFFNLFVSWSSMSTSFAMSRKISRRSLGHEPRTPSPLGKMLALASEDGTFDMSALERAIVRPVMPLDEPSILKIT